MLTSTIFAQFNQVWIFGLVSGNHRGVQLNIEFKTYLDLTEIELVYAVRDVFRIHVLA